MEGVRAKGPAMGKVCAAVCCLLLSVAAVAAQTAQSDRALPQWLTGIMALCGFLFLSFVGFLVKKAWCEEPRSEESYRSLHHLKKKVLCEGHTQWGTKENKTMSKSTALLVQYKRRIE
ncbi:PDZK1-interacting protein 1 [Notothenia coriiceps]|uniref:PDZK1-interacting protein 1 n=1 Tax=Notothenia coriiceps TaxID=8208 RepID=A0A6I9NVQ2_9TELE|nr:PREDICTED: small integral membrane protein 24-like [Notothenia coriiceps]